MSASEAPGSAAVHGQLWGARARDWADFQEPQKAHEYQVVFERLGLGAAIKYCDVGCASGFAAQLAAQRGADVSGIDAAEALIEIARERVPSGDFRVGEMEKRCRLPTTFSRRNYLRLCFARRRGDDVGRIVDLVQRRVA